MISIDPTLLIISIINFLIIIFALNLILYRPIRQILLKRKEMFDGLDQNIKASLSDAEQKDLAYGAGLKSARANGLKEKEVFLQSAAEEEKGIIDEINRKNQENLAEVQAKIAKDTEAAKASLFEEVDVFADSISRKILGRGVS
jgi:F-type H+-transporting ATPase subunit b